MEKQLLLLAEREEKQELKAEKIIQELKAEVERQRQEIEALREGMQRATEKHPLARVLDDSQIAALQIRLSSLHDAQLLTDEEVCTVEDIIADCVQVMASGAFVGDNVVAEVVKIVALSERIQTDLSFARQLKRKCRS